HLKRDADVVREFYRILCPGGVLHVCCPHRLHPRHQAEVLNVNETGGHVRPGYTEEDYPRPMEPLGFRIPQLIGIGPPSVYLADALMRKIRNRIGDLLALPFLPLGLLVVRCARMNPPMPFSLYVKAIK